MDTTRVRPQLTEQPSPCALGPPAPTEQHRGPGRVLLVQPLTANTPRHHVLTAPTCFKLTIRGKKLGKSALLLLYLIGVFICNPIIP